MLIIKNNLIPFNGYKAINICGIIFCRDANISSVAINHEKIHTKQILEMLIIGFYIWYVIEWLIKYAIYKNAHSAYRQVSFEREAYFGQIYDNYSKTRKHYAWIKHVKYNN